MSTKRPSAFVSVLLQRKDVGRFEVTAKDLCYIMLFIAYDIDDNHDKQNEKLIRIVVMEKKILIITFVH